MPIGEYIHYDYQNYLKNGATKYGPAGASIMTIWNQQRQRILRNAHNIVGTNNKDLMKAQVEESLNFFRGGASSQTLKNLDWNPAILEDIERNIQSIVENQLDAVGLIDWDNLDAGSGLKIDSGNLKKQLGMDGKEVSVSSIEARIKILNKTKQDLENQLKLGSVVDTSFIHRVEQLQKQYNSFKSDLNKITRIGRNVTTGQFEKGTSEEYYTNIDQGWLKELNAIWTAGQRKVASYLKGQVGEIYAAVVAQIVKRGATEAINDILDDLTGKLSGDYGGRSSMGLIGNQTSAAVLLEKNFAVTGDLKKNKTTSAHFENGEIFNDFGVGDLKLHYTQDKADLIIDVKDFQGLNLSIKNYNMFGDHNLTIHSGVSILSLIQEYGDFVNHYLNITAKATGAPDDHRDNLGTEITAMNILLKQSMALQGLAGGILKKNKATGQVGPNAQVQMLVINGNDGLYKVFFIDDLISSIINDTTGKLVEIENFSDNQTWSQTWKGDLNSRNFNDAYSRINAILAQLHGFKIKMSLNKIIFT